MQPSKLLETRSAEHREIENEHRGAVAHAGSQRGQIARFADHLCAALTVQQRSQHDARDREAIGENHTNRRLGRLPVRWVGRSWHELKARCHASTLNRETGVRQRGKTPLLRGKALASCAV